MSTSDSNSNSNNQIDLTTEKSPEYINSANGDNGGLHGHQRRSSPALATRLLHDAALNHADLPILVCCIVSGLCDSVAFNATGTFASMQTGNTIFLALGASHLPPNQPTLWLRALVSIASFWAGCLVFSQFHRHSHHPLRKLILAISFFAQTIFILVAAALAQSRTVIPAFGKTLLSTHLDAAGLAIREADENDARTLIPLVLLAFQFGGQIVSSRVLGINEVPTNVLTSLYCDLLSDPLLLAGLGKNKKRDRRLVAIVLLVLGGVAGGWLQRSRAGMSGALWVAGGIKLFLSIAWLFWKEKARPAEGNAKRDAVEQSSAV